MGRWAVIMVNKNLEQHSTNENCCLYYSRICL